jgi:phage tail sheath protein FI
MPAERIVSPGVFTRENDLSFLQQGVSAIGAAFIGPFKEGPAVPTVVTTQTDFENLFGTVDDTYYTPLAVQKYLKEAGVATICRTVGVGGYTERAPLLLTIASGSVTQSLGILFNTDNDTIGFGDTLIAPASITGFGDFNISGSELGFSGSVSLDSSDTTNIEAVFGSSPLGTKGAFVAGFFKNNQVPLNAGTSASVTVLGDQDFAFDAQEALTPMIQSQLISGQRYDLFQFETFGVGNSANEKIKIAISNVKAAGTVSGTDYGVFTITIRAFNDTDKKKVLYETYSNVNLDPASPNYISRVIGDRKKTISSTGKITETGDWKNISKYVRVKNVTTIAPVAAVPFAHAAYKLPVTGTAAQIGKIPAVVFASGSLTDSTLYSGIDLDTAVIKLDNRIYACPVPNSSVTGSNVQFSLDTSAGLSLTSTSSTEIAKRQFVVIFQQGFDGQSPTTPIYKGTDINAGNSQGFNLTSTTSSGSVAYIKHINALANADEWDINMVVTPGLIRRLHSGVVTKVIDMVESRGDAFYIMDSVGADAFGSDSIDAVTGQASAVDSNYVATYYPWIKTIDVNTNKLISVPPSVLLPGVFASNDRVAAEWFAPAGLNRGGLIGAVQVLNRLTNAERDTLYESKVNPIAQFPGQGIVVFGQRHRNCVLSS